MSIYIKEKPSFMIVYENGLIHKQTIENYIANINRVEANIKVSVNEQNLFIEVIPCDYDSANIFVARELTQILLNQSKILETKGILDESLSLSTMLIELVSESTSPEDLQIKNDGISKEQ